LGKRDQNLGSFGETLLGREKRQRPQKNLRPNVQGFAICEARAMDVDDDVER
jgi:hypothetical protein